LAEAVVDLVGLVQIRIVDEALPSDGGAGLLKIDAHDDAQIGENSPMADLRRAAYSRALGVVNGAGADEDEEARIATVEDVTISARALKMVSRRLR